MTARRIALVGAGSTGRDAAGILAARLPEAHFTIFDRDAGNLGQAAVAAPGRTDLVEAVVTASTAPDLSGHDLVLNFAGPFFVASDAVARAALAAGALYVDISDDPEGTKAILALDGEARGRGLAFVTGAGNSPGNSNLMAKRLLELRPDCDGIRVVWAVRDPDPGGLAPLKHMLHMAVVPCPVWQDGALTTSQGFVPETALTHELPEPVGKVTTFDTPHPEPLTLGMAYPHLRHVSVQGALLPDWANSAFSMLGRLGFGDHEGRVVVDDREVDPAEVLWRLLWRRHDVKRRPARPGMTVVQTQGLAGDDVVATMTIRDTHPNTHTTALGAAAVALAILSDSPPPGAHGPEALDAERTLALVQELAGASRAIPDGIVFEDRSPAARQPT
jgi:saccharopine dehydrogenase-like NADP-dependent oxidoreductase